MNRTTPPAIPASPIAETVMPHRSRDAARPALLLGLAALLGAAAPGGDAASPPLRAPDGVTALSGQVLDTQGRPLPEVELLVGGAHVRSGADGRFLLGPVPPGQVVLQIDGRHAGADHKQDHGFYEVRAEARAGRTTVLPYRSYLPLIDRAAETTIASPTSGAVVVGSAAVPGLELHIPAGTVIRDVDGRVATRVGITTMPKDRTPYPLPRDFDLPVFFTIQPGAGCLYDARGGIGTAQIWYPNSGHELPGARATFYRYEPDGVGWRAHGIGAVSADGSQVVPDADTYVTDFDGAECDPKTRTRQGPPARPDPHLSRRPSP